VFRNCQPSNKWCISLAIWLHHPPMHRIPADRLPDAHLAQKRASKPCANRSFLGIEQNRGGHPSIQPRRVQANAEHSFVPSGTLLPAHSLAYQTNTPDTSRLTASSSILCLLRGLRRRHNAKLLQLADKVPQLLGLAVVEFAQIDINLSQQIRHLSAVVVFVFGCGDI
jgi:hypothetical protein